MPLLRPTMPPRRRLATALAALGAAVAIGLTTSPAPAAAAATTDPAEAAAGWLARQMVDGERFEVDFGGGQVFPDQGVTLDAVLGFAAAGAAGDHADAALTWLARPEILANYLGTEFGSAFAGAHAKLAFAVQVYGRDVTDFGGVDLEAHLRALQDPSGRFVDQSGFGDFSNAFSQSFAILALDRSAGGAPVAAVTFLVGEQCGDGGFPLLFAQATCAGDVDATAMVVQALLAVGETQAAAEGLDWLAGRQQPAGGFAGSPPTDVVNANSTGLAAQALRAGGRGAAADQAVAFLRSLQQGCDDPAERRGAVAYDQTGFDEANAVRATAQATLGLAGVGLAELDGTTAAAKAPRLDCDPGTPTPSPTGSATPPAGGEDGDRGEDGDGGAGGGLPATGGPVAALVGVGVALTGAGGLALWTTRWRGRRISRR
jgi:hypothetical protein